MGHGRVVKALTREVIPSWLEFTLPPVHEDMFSCLPIQNNAPVHVPSFLIDVVLTISTDSGVKWAECSLILGTGCRVQVFSLILDSSVGLSASIQSAGDLVSGTPGSNPAFSRGTQLVSFRFEYRLPVPEHRN